MGMRGPKPGIEFGEQKAVLSTRITAETRAAVEKASEQSGRTLSREVEHRLRRSFEDDEKIVDTFGGRQLYAVLRAVAAAMTFAGTRDSPVHTEEDTLAWLNDPHAYRRVVLATIAVLDGLRPEGSPSMLKEIEPREGAFWSYVVLAEIDRAEPIIAAPSEEISDGTRMFRRIASDLGDAKKRLRGRIADREQR